jgi:hypothetical protein
MEVASLILSVLALIIAAVAMWRAAPPVLYRRVSFPDSFEVWNTGPGVVEVTKAEAISPGVGTSGWMPAQTFPVGIELDERLWGDRPTLQPQERYLIEVGVNTSLRLRYRRSGFLGWLMPATVTIHGGT